MEQALKNATEANIKSMEIIAEKDKTISANEAKIKDLEKKLSEKPAPVSISEAPTAEKEAKEEVTYRSPKTVYNAIYPSRKVEEVTVKVTDTKKIKELTDKGYTKIA